MPTLKNTALAAIVKDEIQNPAGGIVRWLDSTLPYVEQAVIVYTGSIDGTREVLEEYAGKYSHLQVHDHKWKGFGDARNFSLSKAKAEKVLVLDADELVTNQERNTEKAFHELIDFVEREEYEGYNFDFFHVPFPGEIFGKVGEHNPRLFQRKGAKYTGKVGEVLINELGKIKVGPSVYLAHFLPPREAKDKKTMGWYATEEFLTHSPSESAREFGWKEFNKRRNEFS